MLDNTFSLIPQVPPWYDFDLTQTEGLQLIISTYLIQRLHFIKQETYKAFSCQMLMYDNYDWGRVWCETIFKIGWTMILMLGASTVTADWLIDCCTPTLRQCLITSTLNFRQLPVNWRCFLVQMPRMSAPEVIALRLRRSSASWNEYLVQNELFISVGLMWPSTFLQ